MKTRTRTAVIAPPPPPAIPGLRGLVSVLALAAIFLIAAPPAEAQTAGTITFSATGSGGDRDATAAGLQVDEGDTVTLTVTANGLTAGRVTFELGLAQAATAVYSSNIGGGDFYSSSQWSESSMSTRRNSQNIVAPATTLQETFTIVDDSDREDAETIVFAFGTGNIVAVGATPSSWTYGSELTVTIRANDQADRDFAISVDNATASEGDSVVFTVSLTGTAPSTAATVDWAISGTGITAADYTLSGDDTDGTLSFTALGSQTLTVALLEDLAAESMETLTITLSNTTGGGGNGNRITTATADVTIAASTLARRLTLTGPATVAEGTDATYTVTLTGTPFANPTAVTWTVTHGETAAADFAATTGSIMFPTATTFTIAIADDDATAPDEPAESFTVTLTAPDTASQITGAGVTTTIGQDDDPSARAARVKTPLATFAKAATHLTAQALSQRLRLNGADTFVSPTNFSLAHSGDGINLWATAGRTNADGNDNNVTYNGDTTALHLGADTTWNDGLLGITIAQSAGDTDFTANDVSSTLKTSLLSIHPYLTRTVNNRKLWATAGYGTGEAQLRENNTMTADTGLSLLSAAIGLTLAESDNASFHLGGQWSRAQLDSATFPTGQVLPKVTATAFRLTGGTELSKQLGNWRPFLTVSIRSDSGDGDDGNGADYGGGVEWQAATVHVRLEGRKHAQGQGPDEENLTLTARKTAGRLNLGLNLTAAAGLNTADLLSGELRF